LVRIGEANLVSMPSEELDEIAKQNGSSRPLQG